MKFHPHTELVASSAGNSIGAFPGQNKRADMLSDGKWGVNGVCMTWRDRGAEGPERVGERSEARVGGLRTREKMKRVACRFWTTYSCTAHSRLFAHWQSCMIWGG